jgi:serine/threonine protein kinase
VAASGGVEGLEICAADSYACAVGLPGATKRELQPGDMLGGYRLEDVLGEGGMGLVFRANRVEDNHEVALKVLKLELADDLLFQHRFRQEARAAAEVREPHLVPIIEASEADGRHYLAVDFVTGGSLTDKIAGSGTLSGEELVRVITEVGAGLDALHEAGIVHRDIKPQNILFSADGTAMLTDFGLAKGRAYTVLTKPGQVMGTLDYLAPELIRGNPATPQTDVYALGCVAFECIAGRAPFADKSLFQVGLAHIQEPPPDPCEGRADLPPGFSTAVLAALEKEPEQRPQTAGAYADLLRAAFEEGRST